LPKISPLPPICGIGFIDGVSIGPILISPSGPCTAEALAVPGSGAIAATPRIAAAFVELIFCPVWGTKVPASPDDVGTENVDGVAPCATSSGGTTSDVGLQETQNCCNVNSDQYQNQTHF